MTLPSSFSIEEIARFPLPGMSIPGSIAFSPDGRLIGYLWSEEGSLTRQLYAFDPETGEHRLLVRDAIGHGDALRRVRGEARRERAVSR